MAEESTAERVKRLGLLKSIDEVMTDLRSRDFSKLTPEESDAIVEHALKFHASAIALLQAVKDQLNDPGFLASISGSAGMLSIIVPLIDKLKTDMDATGQELQAYLANHPGPDRVKTSVMRLMEQARMGAKFYDTYATSLYQRVLHEVDDTMSAIASLWDGIKTVVKTVGGILQFSPLLLIAGALLLLGMRKE